jgi:hypothetical protein
LKQKNNLVVFFSSLQSPAPEISINYYLRYKKKYKKVYFIDAFSNAPLRIDFTLIHGSLRRYLSSFLRNGPIKYIIYKYNIKKILKKNIVEYFIYPKILDENLNKFNLNYDLTYFNVLKKYFCQFSGYSYLRNIRKNNVDIFIKTINWSKTNTIKFIKKNKLTSTNSVFLIHNGYHPIEYGIKEALIRHTYLITESNTYVKKFLVRSEGFHDLKTFSKEILEFFKKIQKKFLLVESAINIMKFKGYQKKILKKKKRRIVFLTSSINEFVYTYENPINQIKIIKKILESKKFNQEYEFIVRVHPNSQTYSDANKNIWYLLKELYPNQIILFDENENTYDLMKSSILTMGVGSVCGLESTILNVNHILFGDQSMWSNLKLAKNIREKFSINYLLNIIKYSSKKIITNKCKELAASAYLYEYCYGKDFIYPLWSKFPYHTLKYKKLINIIIKKIFNA